jgi:addiction module RelE/StbE family toxin
MYQVEFLPIAKKDIEEIIYYISNDLKNLSAARNLSNSFIEGINNILVFPFGLPVYQTLRKLKNEYRCIKVKNFLMFYTINEKEKIITIVRVLYKKMDINNILE